MSKAKEAIGAKATPAITATAKALAVDASAAAGYGLDPLTIAAILIGLIQIFLACRKTAEQAAAELRRPSRLARAMVKRECRKRVGDRDAADILADAVLSHAEHATAVSVAELMAEVE